MGLPIARAVAILSLATACVMDLALGPYKGKETGESALLRALLNSLAVGDKQHPLKESLRGKMQIAGWNDDFLAQVLTGQQV